jgi:hypothetical protein
MTNETFQILALLSTTFEQKLFDKTFRTFLLIVQVAKTNDVALSGSTCFVRRHFVRLIFLSFYPNAYCLIAHFFRSTLNKSSVFECVFSNLFRTNAFYSGVCMHLLCQNSVCPTVTLMAGPGGGDEGVKDYWKCSNCFYVIFDEVATCKSGKCCLHTFILSAPFLYATAPPSDIQFGQTIRTNNSDKQFGQKIRTNGISVLFLLSCGY